MVTNHVSKSWDDPPSRYYPPPLIPWSLGWNLKMHNIEPESWRLEAEIFRVYQGFISSRSDMKWYEQWKNTLLFRVYRGWKTTQLNGDYFINHDIRIPSWNNQYFNGKYRPVFFWYLLLTPSPESRTENRKPGENSEQKRKKNNHLKMYKVGPLRSL